MLLELARWLESVDRLFAMFNYLTLRAILSALTALGLSLLFGPAFIRKLARLKSGGQPIRTDGPQSHFSKAGTPTMGGGLILFAVTLSTLLWANLSNRYIWIVLAGVAVPRGLGCVAVAYFWIVGFSNAVNLTDGLDGLAIMPTVLVAGALGVFAYLSGHAQFAHYLLIPALPGSGELIILCAAIGGAGLGFLWFNTFPAQVFMGDIGALALGAVLGTVAVIVRQELVLVVMGGIFVIETLSVMIQVASFKLTGRRVFRMAPIHHHFELKGWPEPRVIVRFWIISVVLVLIGLATLKVR